MAWGIVSKTKFNEAMHRLNQTANALMSASMRITTLEASLKAANDHALELTEELEARAATIARGDEYIAQLTALMKRAQHDAAHFEREYHRSNDRADHLRDQVAWWKGEAERAFARAMTTTSTTPGGPAVDNMARLRTALQAAEPAETSPAEETEAAFAKGLWTRFNEIHNDGWRPPDPDAVIAEKDTFTDE